MSNSQAVAFIVVGLTFIGCFLHYISLLFRDESRAGEIPRYLLRIQQEENEKLRSEIASLHRVITNFRQKWVAPDMQWQAAQELADAYRNTQPTDGARNE